MMGISLPDLPASCSEENINFGDKDSIRRRALHALEGRNDLGSCNNMVEIPDFNSQGMPQKPFDREGMLAYLSFLDRLTVKHKQSNYLQVYLLLG